jgi:ADP-heptose:LPS heptosyltransferase
VGERFNTRALVVSRALARRMLAPGVGQAPANPKRILVAHHLLLGDTLMLTPLLAKLRANHPDADIAMTVPLAFVPLYATRPWGVRALPFSPRAASTASALFEGEETFDLAIVPGDNRHSWLAAALGARYTVAHAGDVPATKNWFVDDARDYRDTPASWGDLVMDLADGVEPAFYARGDWRAPEGVAVERPAGGYAVLHVGASTPLKHWRPERWAALAEHLTTLGLTVVWSAGRGEEAIVDACDPAHRFASTAGRLDLAQMWHLLAGAQLLVSPDTGIAHLGRVTWTPTLVLFGPGSAVLCGPGKFWQATPWRALTVDPFECRDQAFLFRRNVAWVRRCARSTRECAAPRCMEAIELGTVTAAADELLRARP